MIERPTIVVLGSFLRSEYRARWQRQQEFTTCLMGHANVLFVERAAPGTVTAARVVGRLRTLARRTVSVAEPATPFPDSPGFVRWLQVPASGEQAWRASARSVLRAIERERAQRGWAVPSMAVCGTPTEVWRHVLEELGVPFWYDLWERVLASETYATTDRDSMSWIARSAAVMTTDTDVGAEDWRTIRDDILVVPHGAKEWAAEPDFDRVRDRLYYVGSVSRALDASLVRGIADEIGDRVRMIGTDPGATLGDAVDELGWRGAGDIPAVLSDAAAGLVPYRVDDFGAGVYPTKVYDYLLAGAPVIATALPSLAGLPHVETCESATEFASAFERAKRLSTEERRQIRAYALENGWSRRFEGVLGRLAVAVPAAFGGGA